ncbi:MAG TPA: sugar transferase [Terriglobales bacterium]|jgi:lipopolysaccharide/colanic/teichoic acid biosynthesis glycosyltransferase
MNTRRLEVWIWLADLAWIFAGFFGADMLRFGTTWSIDERASIQVLVPFVVATCITWSALSVFMQMDGFRGGWRASAVFSQILLGMFCTLAVLTVLGYFTRTYVSRLALTYFIFLLGAGFIGIRFGTRLLLGLWHDGGILWRVLVIGNGRVAQEVAAKIEQHPETLCKVVGHLFPSHDSQESFASPEKASVFSSLQVFDLLRELRVNEIILALPYVPSAEIRKMIAQTRNMGICTSMVPQNYELYAYRPKLFSLDGLPLLHLQEPGLRQKYVLLKRGLDFAVASALIVPAAVLIFPAALVLLAKRHSAFRCEPRVGQNGCPFSMWRLNVHRPADPKSRFESILDYFSITELPQLWNVITGRMSLVGPRPEPPVRIEMYSEWQHRRLRVKPGMTGLAQVHGLREYSSSEEKTRFDLQYVMDPHLLWDISLLLQTMWTLATRMFSRVPGRKTYEMNWKAQERSSQGLMSNADRAQPGTN